MYSFEIVVTENPVVVAILAAHNATLAETRHQQGQDEGIGAYAERFGPNFRAVQLAIGRWTDRWDQPPSNRALRPKERQSSPP